MDVDSVISMYIWLNAWNSGFLRFPLFLSLALRTFRLKLEPFLHVSATTEQNMGGAGEMPDIDGVLEIVVEDAE